MDFESLLHVAQRNSQNDKKSEAKNKCYSTKFSAPKKVEKDKKLSANIQKFLQKKEEEEKEKARQAQKNLQDLMAMRSEKTKNKIRKMLKVTKSANKSVLADAIDNDNTAVTITGPEQPDEDDYGYVSQEASQLYRQLMDKYKSGPTDERNKKFAKAGRPTVTADLSSTKDRVREAIRKEQEEENMPHRRQRQTGSQREDEKSDRSDDPKQGHRRRNLYDPEAERQAEMEQKKEEQRRKQKSRKPPPPPGLDFRQLLQLAEKKQFEPVEIEVETKPKEPERLLTNREKRELEEKRQYFAEREKRKQMKCNSKNDDRERGTETSQPRKMEPNGRIPKLSSSDQRPQASMKPLNKPPEPRKNNTSNTISKQSASSASTTGQRSGISVKPPSTHASSSSASSSNRSNSIKPSSSGISTGKPSLPPPSTSKSVSSTKSTSGGVHNSKHLNGNGTQTSSRPHNVPTTLTKPSSTKTAPSNSNISSKVSSGSNPSSNISSKVSTSSNPSSTTSKTREFPPKDVIRKQQTQALPRQKPNGQTNSGASTSSRDGPIKTRPFPPYDTKKVPEKTRAFPPYASEKTRQFPPNDVRRSREPQKKPVKRHVIDDDDSEYDSEMDDFIDDGPDDNDYSKHIKEIFGYDRARYRGLDDDVDNMESTFAQQMKEEYISKKIGIMEDLEDMRMEAEEKKRSKTKKRRID